MACSAPHEVSDLLLLKYLDGEDDGTVAGHLARCPDCRQRAQVLAAEQRQWTAALYRAACPSPDALGEHHLGLLAPDQATSVAAHLATCPHCRAELEQLRSFLKQLRPEIDPGLARQVRDRVRVLVAWLVTGPSSGGPAGQPALAPAFAALRGDEAAPRLYQANGLQIAVETQPDPELPKRRLLLGLVSGLESCAQFRAHLWRGEELVATAKVDDLGNCCLAGLAPGAYELILAGPGLEVHIHDVQV
jgi:anti-sigma factor RsiW